MIQVNSNGVISFGGEFTNINSRHFPYTATVIIVCPFWTDLHSENTGTVSQNSVLNTNKMNRITQLIQESFGYSYIPTGVFTVTWDAVPYYGSDKVSVLIIERYI